MNGQMTRGEQATAEPVGLPVWKRALDLTLILLSAPIWATACAAIALIVRFGSRGPVLFKQERVGFRGQLFTIYKFRTMLVDADKGKHRDYTRDLLTSDKPMTKLDGKANAGLVPFGKILRATGIDELPQIFNVLKGEMSIVGPRPCIQYEFDLYEDWQKRRSDAVPGLTGLWQVSGKNRTTFVEMINYDLQYSRDKSLLMDLKIIMKTLPALWQQCQDARAQKRKEVRHTQAESIPNSVQTYRL